MTNRRPPTVPDLLRDRAADEPGKIALDLAGRGAISFRDWDSRSTSLAHGLLEAGIGRGERVVLRFGPAEWTDYAVAYCAVLRAGAVAVPVSDRLAPPEFAWAVAHCGAAIVVRGATVPVPPEVPAATATLADLDTGGAGQLDAAPGPDEVAQILYTSGTTGRPKGVSATHGNLTFGATRNPRRRAFAHSRHLLHAFPIGTNAAQLVLVHALTATPTILTLPRFTPERFARLIAEYAVGTVFLVPAMGAELLAARVGERHDLSSVRLLGSAAAPLPPAVAAGLAEAFSGAAVVNYYTSTEAAPAQTIMIYDPARPGSLGRPVAGGELRVTGPGGRPAGPGTVGEVWLRAPATPRAYVNDERATGEVFQDGWVRMGDLGYLDADGHLYLVDREADVVKSGAFKVSTVQVEAALHEHPDVVEAAVVGLAHPVLGASIAAAVVAKKALTLGGVRRFLAGRLAEHELPTRLLTLDALPRNDGGKVVKRELRELITAAAARPG